MLHVLKAVFTFFLLGYAVALVAQTNCGFRLRGRVLNESQEPLAGATVVLTEPSKGESTNQEGAFEFRNVCAGRYTVEVRFVGYQAQQQVVSVPQSDDVVFALVVDATQLNEVVVTDRRAENPVSTATVITAKQLEAAPGKSLGEVLQTVSGVNSIQSGPAIFKPVIHGVHSQRVLILNNGIRQEGQQWGAEHAPEIDPFTAHTITVIKDAGAIKYGTDALGGVIIITPAELPEEPGLGGQVNMIANSNNRGLTFSGMLEGGLAKPGWGWRVQGTGKYAGDSRAPDYVLSNTGFREQNFSAALGYHRKNKGVEVYYSQFNTEIGILKGSSTSNGNDLVAAIENEPPRLTAPFTYAIGQPRQEVRHDLIKLNGHLSQGAHTWQVQYGFQYNERQEFDIRRGSLRQRPQLAFDLFTHTLDVDWETAHENRIRCRGINGMFQDNNKIDGTSTIPFIPNFRHYSVGAFWIEQFRGPRWDTEIGVRYDYRLYDASGFTLLNRPYESQVQFHNMSGTLGATRKLSPGHKLINTLATAWRPPNVAELYSAGTHQSVATIEYGLLLTPDGTAVRDYRDSNVRPEQAVKWVSTYQWTARAFSLEVSAYANYIANYIYLRPRGVNSTIRGFFPLSVYTQTDASFLGADLKTTWQWNRELSSEAKASWLRATDERENDFLIFIPSNRVELSMRYEPHRTLGTARLFAEARGRYVARQQRAPRVVRMPDIIDNALMGRDIIEEDPRNFDFVAPPPAYVWLGCSVGAEIPAGKTRMTVRLAAENLLNTSYREYTNRMRYYADEVGRNINLALKWAF